MSWPCTFLGHSPTHSPTPIPPCSSHMFPPNPPACHLRPRAHAHPYVHTHKPCSPAPSCTLARANAHAPCQRTRLQRCQLPGLAFAIRRGGALMGGSAAAASELWRRPAPLVPSTPTHALAEVSRGSSPATITPAQAANPPGAVKEEQGPAPAHAAPVAAGGAAAGGAMSTAAAGGVGAPEGLLSERFSFAPVDTAGGALRVSVEFLPAHVLAPLEVRGCEEGCAWPENS